MIYNNTRTQLNGYQFVILCGCCSFSRCNCRIFQYNFVETEKRSFCSGWTIYKNWSLNTSIFLLTWAHVLVVVNRLRKLRKGTKKYAWTSVTLWPKCQCTPQWINVWNVQRKKIHFMTHNIFRIEVGCSFSVMITQKLCQFQGNPLILFLLLIITPL